VQFYSEVLVFAFFTSAANPDDASSSMLPVPWVVLGARRYLRELTGESMGDMCGRIQAKNWINEELPTHSVDAPVAGVQHSLMSSAFVGVASVCTECRQGGSCSHEEMLNNKCDAQRRHLDEDIALWYQAYEPAMYDSSVQQAFRAVIGRIGTGPWGAGVWYGDSQQYFLTVWLATSLLEGASLDYYIYDSFCENEGNQCFVLGSNENCEACVEKGALPGSGVKPSHCGPRGIRDVVEQFRDRPARELYDALAKVGPPPHQVFDLLDGK